LITRIYNAKNVQNAPIQDNVYRENLK